LAAAWACSTALAALSRSCRLCRPHHQHHGGGHAERLGIARELLGQRLRRLARDARLRHEEARGGRDDQRRDLRDEAVAHRQDRIHAARVAEGHVLLGDADDDAADDIDEGDEQAGDGIAAHELRGAVHGAKERGLVLERLAPRLRALLVDQSRVEVRVDRHLLAGHGVEGEAGRDLGDAARALGDDDEVHDHQDREDDDSDDEIAAHHELAEGLDHVAGRVRAVVPVGEDETRRGEVEREPEHGRDQQHGREDREFEGRRDEQRHHQDQHREDDRGRQEEVEEEGRQRHDEDREDHHHADRQQDVAALQQVHRARETRSARALWPRARRRHVRHRQPTPSARRPRVATDARQSLPGAWLRIG
jgi:hypothetical protein